MSPYEPCNKQTLNSTQIWELYARGVVPKFNIFDSNFINLNFRQNSNIFIEGIKFKKMFFGIHCVDMCQNKILTQLNS